MQSAWSVVLATLVPFACLALLLLLGHLEDTLTADPSEPVAAPEPALADAAVPARS